MFTDPSAAVIVPIRKPDLALSEGELKLLDLSLQEQHSARDAFFRDFKLARPRQTGYPLQANQERLLLPWVTASRRKPVVIPRAHSLPDRRLRLLMGC